MLTPLAHIGVTFGAQCDATINGLVMQNAIVFEILYRTDVNMNVNLMLTSC